MYKEVFCFRFEDRSFDLLISFESFLQIITKLTWVIFLSLRKRVMNECNE